jgi:hypothetical protein
MRRIRLARASWRFWVKYAHVAIPVVSTYTWLLFCSCLPVTCSEDFDDGASTDGMGFGGRPLEG